MVKKMVTMRALLQRINRALEKEGEQLKTLRGDAELAELGRYYVVDYNTNTITAQHVDPEAWGRELGVLKAYEQVRKD